MKKKIITTEIDTGSFESFVDRIIGLSTKGNSSYTCCVNVHMLVEAYKDEEFRALVNQADLNTPDGMPLAIAMRFLHNQKQERVAGMDLFPALLQQAAQKQLKVFFYGDTAEVLAKLRAKALQEFPALQIVGLISPPFQALSKAKETEIVRQINEANPDLLFVALGCPKQEKWMAQHKGKVKASMIGIGNAFRTYLNYEKRAPMWMQKIALEWCYRLFQNPNRLFKRYLYTNTLFLYLLITGHTLNRKNL